MLYISLSNRMRDSVAKVPRVEYTGNERKNTASGSVSSARRVSRAYTYSAGVYDKILSLISAPPSDPFSFIPSRRTASRRGSWSVGSSVSMASYPCIIGDRLTKSSQDYSRIIGVIRENLVFRILTRCLWHRDIYLTALVRIRTHPVYHR